MDQGLYDRFVRALGNKYSTKGEPYMIRRSEGHGWKSWDMTYMYLRYVDGGTPIFYGLS